MIKGRFKPDCIVGIGRGGLVPAVYLSDRLGVNKLYVIKVGFYKKDRRNRRPVVHQKPPLGSIHGNVLVVDDVADTGETLMLVKKLLKRHAGEIRIATLHYKPHSKLKPDFFVHTTKRWIIYPYQKVEMRT
jgi:hypoxanthine phosphoribosyltransferase